ncbi:class I SAM-dependent methyltransferase [Ketobacter sp.]|nr:MAG: class I SAM-dependent methyltransferase [Ketobacter sp.]
MTESTDQNWLLSNKHIRMDANTDNNPKIRRDFHIERYRFAAKFIEGMTVLDGACGTGYGSEILGQSAARVFGIDLDPGATDYASKKYGSETINFRTSAVELTPFEDSFFDAVVSYETVEHTLSPESHFKEIIRVLKPNGIAFISIPNSWGYTDQHFFDFNLDMLKSYTGRFFSDVEFFANNPTKKPSENNGIDKLTSKNERAECILAICRNPNKSQTLKKEERIDHLMADIYKNAFKRHNEYLNLKGKILYTGLNPLVKSLFHKIRRRF